MNARRRKSIYGLLVAECAFTEASSLIDILLAEHQKLSKAAYRGIVGGIAVAYGRPFSANNGASTLPPEFLIVEGDSPPPIMKLQRVHDHLIDTRHELAAHFDFKKASKRPSINLKDVPLDDIVIQLDRGKVTSVYVPQLEPRPEFFIPAQHLLKVQRNRLRALLKKHLASWTNGASATGTFRVTETGLESTDRTYAG